VSICPVNTDTVIEPQTWYELGSTAAPDAGKPFMYPIWK